MGECSTLGQNLPSGSGLCGIKRSHSSDDSDDATIPTKVFKNDICRLIDLPERHTDPGSETEFSFQEEETDLCCRSSETSSSEWSERNAVGRVEFEIRSPNEGPNPFGDSSTASDASVNELQVVGLPPPKTWDNAGNSSCASSGSSDVFDPEIPRRDYWTCLQCSNVNNRPAFRYCEKCYKVRRDMYQPRVKPRKRRKRKSSKGVATARNSIAMKAVSERTTSTNKFQPNSTMFRDTFKSCDDLKTSPIAFSGVKLESCSQENRDSGVACSQSSGVACSQSTVASALPASGKDSDSSLSPDSGADTREFHGIKLSSTREHSLKVSSLGLDLRQSVDVVDLLARVTRREACVIASQSNNLHQDSSRNDSTSQTSCRDVQRAESLWPSQSQAVHAVRTLYRSVDEVDAVEPYINQCVDEVDTVNLSSSQGVDEVNTVHPSTVQGVDEVDAVHPSMSPGVNEVNTVHPSMSPGVDEVDAVHPSTSQGVDEVDAVHPSTSQGVDEVDAVHPSTSQGVDEVDAVHPSTSQGVDEVDAVHPSTSQGVDEVDAVHPSTSQGVDEVDAVHPSTSQGVDEVDAVHPSTSQGVDEVDAVRPSTSQGVDEVDAVRPSTSQGVDEVDAVRPSTSQGVDEVDAVRPSTSQGVDEVDAVRPSTSQGVDEVDAVRPSTSQGVDEVDAVRPSTSEGVDEVDAVRPSTSQGVDEDDAVLPSTSQGVDEVDAVRPSTGQSADEVDSACPSTGCDVVKVDAVWPPVSQSVDEVDTGQQHTSRIVDEVDYVQHSSKGSVYELRSVKTQTDLCFISKSDIPKEKPIVDVDKCMTCYSRSLDGIFVHSKYAHMCCCYKCTVRVWKTTKRCPLCNCKVMNVLRLFKGC
ncbi:uncharacterized protein LOC126292216 isoform X2 [Schistocerca gregaria]|nr:uncharacterized protein LOC126292216 isoform X2 [Schistocerca gregaria]XP_049842034.1 uncharacterized protein LOC126292216 isoform X2 [Schistocerca gregaria]